MKAAAALACLLALAACGGGGGGGGSAAGGGGDPAPMEPDPWYLVEDMTQVMGVDAAIVLFTPPAPPRTFASVGWSRAVADDIYYIVTTVGDGAPSIYANDPFAETDFPAMDSEELGDNVWLFSEDYTQTSDSTDYRARVVMSYDTALTDPADKHYWGVWLRQNATTDAWDNVEAFNRRTVSEEADLGDPDVQNALTGTATFTGKALGVYTKDGTKAGWFSADASLTANYSDATAPFTMTGTIDKFVLSGREDVGWTVTLAGEPGKPSGGGLPTNTDWYGTTSGDGGVTTDGEFRALLSGTASQPPSRVRGIFDAHFSDGKAVGAFNGTTP